MTWTCSECRHGNCSDCKGTVAGDQFVCRHELFQASRIAYAIRLGDRYYRKHSKWRVLTAWSIAGATLFVSRYEAFRVGGILEREHGKSFRVAAVMEQS